MEDHQSCVGSESDLFSVGVAFCQGVAFSIILLVIFMDNMNIRRSHGEEGFQVSDQSISSLLFTDDVVLIAPSAPCIAP